MDIPPQQYFELRSRAIQKLRETQSPNPYPHKFDVTSSITNYIENFGDKDLIQPGEKLEGTTVSLAGRVHNIRASGQKLRFYDLHGEGKKVQIMATLQCVFFLNLNHHCSSDIHDIEMRLIQILLFQLMKLFVAVTSSVSPGHPLAPRRANFPSHPLPWSSSHPISTNYHRDTLVSRTKRHATASATST